MPGIISEEDKPDFVTPGVVNNPVGWGPISIPEQFRDIPYQPFSKSDNLGQVRIAQNIYLRDSFLGVSFNFWME